MKRGNQRTLYSVEYIWRREMIERDLSRITIPAVLDGTSTDHYHSASVNVIYHRKAHITERRGGGGPLNPYTTFLILFKITY